MALEMTMHDVGAILERTPGVLRALLAGMPESWLDANEGPDTFSPKDVLGHLISGEETDWIPRLRIILEHGEARPFTPFDRFAFRVTCGGMDVDALLDRFAALREENLGTLRGLGLGASHLRLTGTHPSLGRVTLAQLLASWAVHDLGHIRQVVRVMANQYGEAVGPWREYLPIVQR